MKTYITSAVLRAHDFWIFLCNTAWSVYEWLLIIIAKFLMRRPRKLLFAYLDPLVSTVATKCGKSGCGGKSECSGESANGDDENGDNGENGENGNDENGENGDNGENKESAKERAKDPVKIRCVPVDITPILYTYYSADAVLSCYTLQEWLKRFDIQTTYVNLVYIRGSAIMYSRLDLNNDIETVTGTESVDTALATLPGIVLHNNDGLKEHVD